MKKAKSQLSILEKFGIISSFIFSFIALGFNIVQFVYDNILEKSENVLILAEYESDYIFDGNKLYRNISIVVANNSDINVSIVEMKVKIGDKYYSFGAIENEVCPINMNPNVTIVKTIPILKEIDDIDRDYILNRYGKNSNIDPYELETYFEVGENIENLYNTVTNPRIEIELKTSKNNIIRFYRMAGAGNKF